MVSPKSLEGDPVCELESLGGSEYLNTVFGAVVGCPPQLDLEMEKSVQAVIREAIAEGLLLSAHDCSDGGLAVNIAESCIQGKVGANISLLANCAPAAALFNEAQSRIVVSLTAKSLGKLRELVDAHHVECSILGRTGGEKLLISVNDVEIVNLDISKIEATWRNSISSLMKD